MLSDYVDLELPTEACGEVESHLADCPACVEFVESLRNTIALCHTWRVRGGGCWQPANSGQ